MDIKIMFDTMIWKKNVKEFSFMRLATVSNLGL